MIKDEENNGREDWGSNREAVKGGILCKSSYYRLVKGRNERWQARGNKVMMIVRFHTTNDLGERLFIVFEKDDVAYNVKNLL